LLSEKSKSMQERDRTSAFQAGESGCDKKDYAFLEQINQKRKGEPLFPLDGGGTLLR